MRVELEELGAIGVLRLRRPERANALNRQLLEALAERQEFLRTHTGIRVLVTVGEGKGFSAGSDLEELAAQSVEEAGAFVAFREGQSATPNELQRWCLNALSGFKVPEEFRVCTEFPRTSVGKIQQHLLRRSWLEAHVDGV